MKVLKKLIVALLIVSLTLSSVSPNAFADEPEENLENYDIEENLEDYDIDENLEDILNTVDIEDLDEEESDAELQAVFYRSLTTDECDAKEELSNDYIELQDADEDEDYVRDEVFAFCDTEEEAIEIANAYETATGYKFTLKKLSDGVATFNLSGSKKESENRNDKLSLNRVEYAIYYAQNKGNNLPAVYPNFERYAYAVSANDENFNDPFLNENSDYYQWYHNIINDKYIWAKYVDVYYSSPKRHVTVAVLDSGIDAVKYNGTITHCHIDFDNIVDTRSYSVFTSQDKDIDENDLEITDYYGHGTNVAGIIGSVANDRGGRGVASGVKILSVKVFNHEGKTHADEITRGLNYVYNNYTDDIKVINISLGGPYYNSAEQEMITKLRHEKNITVVVSAGNDNSSVSPYPAGYEDVLCVAAVNSNLDKSDFSNY